MRCQQPNHAVGGEPDAKGDLADRGQPSIDQEGAEDLARLQRDAVGNATGEGFAGQVDQLLVGCLLERARQLCKPRDSTIPRHFSGEQESVPLPRQPLLEIHEGSFPYICNQTLESNFHYSILFLGMQSNSMGGFSRDCGIAVEGVAFPRKRRPFRQNSAYAVENPVYNLPQMWNRKDRETPHKACA